MLCVSATTAADLTERLGVPGDRVDVTPLGTDLRPAADSQVAELRRRLGLDGPYLLGLGTVEPRKDLPTLVRAFAALAAELPHRLVLAGLAGWGAGELEAAVAASGVADRILVTGYVADADKAAPLLDIVRSTVVVRDDEARPPREALPLRVPTVAADAAAEEPTTDESPATPARSADDLRPFERGPEITEVR